DARTSSVYDVKALLHPGANTIAVALANWGTAAGVNKGVELRLYDLPPPPAWSRTTFNGLAQVIVRTSKQSGSLQLTARAPGLTPATLPLAAAAVTPRAGVE